MLTYLTTAVHAEDNGNLTLVFAHEQVGELANSDLDWERFRSDYLLWRLNMMARVEGLFRDAALSPTVGSKVRRAEIYQLQSLIEAHMHHADHYDLLGLGA